MKNGIEEITKHYYTGNHLSSTQLVTDGTGVAVQQVEYAPFGEVVNEYNINWSNGQVPDFKFNGKELDEESGMYYFEARYQRPPVFISRDVLFEKYPTLSPYSYCANNPEKYVDPTGMVIDDYFNEHGQYLGKDNAQTDKVRIICQEDWDNNKIIGADGNATIEHQKGNDLSFCFSEANLDKSSQLAVYMHYNPTDLDVYPDKKELPTSQGGMIFQHRKNTQEDGTSTWTADGIAIRLQGNINCKFTDNANEIINMFIHEGQHYYDFKSMGGEAFDAESVRDLEKCAIEAQMNHSTWNKTRRYFRDRTLDYGRVAYGIFF
jgi:RHS repeat-associated protein